MLKTFALRGREVPITIYGPPGLERPVRLAAADLREAHLPVRAGRAPAGRRARARRLPARDLPGRSTASRRSATRWSRTTGRAASTSRRPTRSASRSGPSAARSSAASPSRSPTGASSRPSRCSASPGPGRTVVIAGDTAPARSVLEAARGADLLVHEATFLEDERERAQETAHSTAPRRRELARDAGVRMLALTHLSHRYFGPRGRPRGARGLPRDGRPAGLRRHRDPVPRSAARRSWSRAARSRAENPYPVETRAVPVRRDRAEENAR